MASPPAAVIVAAGASTRMGRPKALIRWRGRTFVEHAIALARGCTPVVVVTGAVVLPPSVTAGATVVHHPRWAEGQMSSLQRGLLSVPLVAGVMVLTIDRPHIDPSTVCALLEAYAAQPTRVWQPQHGDRRGHPIIYPPPTARALLHAELGATQRTVLARPEHAARRATLSVADAAVVQNLDRPEDLELL